MAKFTHLHTHSHYSLLDGLPKIDQMLDHVKNLGMDSLAITDHGNIYGAVEFYKKAKERGIKPIIGAEMYQAFEGYRQERPNIDDKRYHIILLVKNEAGYKNLVKLITRSYLEGFYYKPRIDEELLKEHSEGLIALSACLQGKVSQLVLANKLSEAREQALKYQEIFGRGNFYLELQHHPNISVQAKVNSALIDISKKTGVPLVATADSHYLKKEDAEAQDILMLINTGADPKDLERLTMKSDDFSIKSPEEMAEFFKDTPQTLANTQKIVEDCDFEFDLGKIKLPQFSTPEGKTADEYLKELCKLGLKKRYGAKVTKEILERLNYELAAIKQAGFASYFLIVQDFVNWAKENRIVVGPGRGSAGGSLVAYLLNITNVDPLKYNLLFERFLNPGRTASLPDIDLDFTDRRRDEVINYVAQKYGKDRVAQIITFGTMASRAVVRDVGRALGYAYPFCDKIAKMIPFGLTLDQTLAQVPEFRQIYLEDPQAQKLIDFAKKLEGCARHASTHACGVVISAEPLDSIVPLQHPTQNDKAIVTQYEMHSVEDLGLLKMDFLGLKNLTIIEDTLARIYKVQGKSIDIQTLPLDDKNTFKLLQKAETTSVFQLECLAGDTQVSTTTLKKLYERKNKKVLHSLYFDEGKVHKNKILDVVSSGKKELYALIAENNWFIKASKDHYFFTGDGWKKLSDLKVGEKVLIKSRCEHFTYNTCKICSKQISGQKEGQSKFCYKCSAIFYRNPSKKESREKIKAAMIRFYQRGGKPWNLKLTAENNETLRATGEKISKALNGRSLEERWGKEKAEKFKRAHSERNLGENNPMFGKPSPHRKGGFRKDLGHYVRSNWEADFARILKLYNTKYEYEPRSFELTRPNGQKLCYTPDFYTPHNNTFYEVKGWMHDLDSEKINLFKEQYPQYGFILINTARFAEFALRFKDLIKWECPRIPIKTQFNFIKIKEIKYCGEEPTYDIIMQAPGNNYVANGFIVHNSDGMKRYLKELKPTELEDIIAMVALYRPGPMQFIPDYIAGKHKKKKVEYLHPKLKPILEKTYGVCIFQEQLMEIAKELAGFTLSDADVLRKAVGKKIKKLLDAQQEKLVKGMAENGIPEKTAKEIWQWTLPFARYGFNKSHSTAYALIAYQTAFLKANFPVEFMASVLTSEKADVERIGFLIAECKKIVVAETSSHLPPRPTSRGSAIEVLPPDVNESLENFTVVPPKQIRFGLLAVKNVGYNVVEAIVKERKAKGPYRSIFDFVSRVNSKDLNKKSLESLIKAGAFDKLGERAQLLFNLEKLLEASRESQKNKVNGQKGLFDGIAQNVNFKLEERTPATKAEKLKWEKELLGLFVTSHPLEDFRKILEKKCLAIQKTKNGLVNRVVRIGGLISSIKKIITKTGRPMLFMNLEDLEDKIEVVVFPGIIERNYDIFQENKIVFVQGRVDNRDGIPKIIAETVEEILET